MVDLANARDKWDFSELPSLAGKVALVTGANSPNGIGYNIAHQLFLKGAKVYIGARSIEKATSAISILSKSAPNLDSGLLKPFVADLADLVSVQRAAKLVLSEEDRLDILVNNAAYTGLLDRSEISKVDAYGISPVIAVNHLGGFVLTTTLLPLLTKTAKLPNTDVRVITVSSVAIWEVPSTAKFDSLEALNNTYENIAETREDPSPLFAVVGASFGESDKAIAQANFTRYGYGKLANVLFTSELQRRLDAQGVPILALSVHPGGVATNGAAGFLGEDNELFKQSITPAEGAITPLFAAAHPEPRGSFDTWKGGFVMPFGGLKEPSDLAKDEGNARQLWETSEKVLESVFKA